MAQLDQGRITNTRENPEKLIDAIPERTQAYLKK